MSFGEETFGNNIRLVVLLVVLVVQLSVQLSLFIRPRFIRHSRYVSGTGTGTGAGADASSSIAVASHDFFLGLLRKVLDLLLEGDVFVFVFAGEVLPLAALRRFWRCFAS
jgi:small basic protein